MTLILTDRTDRDYQVPVSSLRALVTIAMTRLLRAVKSHCRRFLRMVTTLTMITKRTQTRLKPSTYSLRSALASRACQSTNSAFLVFSATTTTTTTMVMPMMPPPPSRLATTTPTTCFRVCLGTTTISISTIYLALALALALRSSAATPQRPGPVQRNASRATKQN